MRLVSLGGTPDEAATVVLGRSDLRVIAGGLSEALFELSESEFSIRVGVSADDAKAFVHAVTRIRDDFDRRAADDE